MCLCVCGFMYELKSWLEILVFLILGFMQKKLNFLWYLLKSSCGILFRTVLEWLSFSVTVCVCLCVWCFYVCVCVYEDKLMMFSYKIYFSRTLCYFSTDGDGFLSHAAKHYPSHTLTRLRTLWVCIVINVLQNFVNALNTDISVLQRERFAVNLKWVTTWN